MEARLISWWICEAEETFAEPDRGHWHFVTGQPGWITGVTSSRYAFADSQEERGARVPTGSSDGVRRWQGTNVERRERLWRSITYVRESVTPRDENALFFSPSTSLFAPRFEQTRQILDNVLHVEAARVNDQGSDSAESRGWIRHANISVPDIGTRRHSVLEFGQSHSANVDEIVPTR